MGGPGYVHSPCPKRCHHQQGAFRVWPFLAHDAFGGTGPWRQEKNITSYVQFELKLVVVVWEILLHSSRPLRARRPAGARSAARARGSAGALGARSSASQGVQHLQHCIDLLQSVVVQEPDARHARVRRGQPGAEVAPEARVMVARRAPHAPPAQPLRKLRRGHAIFGNRESRGAEVHAAGIRDAQDSQAMHSLGALQEPDLELVLVRLDRGPCVPQPVPPRGAGVRAPEALPQAGQVVHGRHHAGERLVVLGADLPAGHVAVVVAG
mmetsp:Transcript_99960/g.282951  ORF Transcript_99960/g.282951 Transcript_99960/m.282951 type:complete len:267 (+) Transcript_99960:123-923(+)